MQIRLAAQGDIPGLLGLLQQVGRVHHDIRPDLFRSDACKYDEKALHALLQDGQRPIFVAEEDGILGYAFCILQRTEKDSVLADKRTVYIDDLCVDNTCRGQGVGKALYQTVLDFARQWGAYNVTLNVWAGNDSALHFYEKMGLKPQKFGMETILQEE